MERFPEGFEEVENGDSLELAAYVDEIPGELHAATIVAVADDWQERWRAFHRPARVGKLWIGPPWEHVPAGTLPVVIDPGRAFGTGAHATTKLCLECLLALRPTSVLDIGCGSGVVAIAAAKLGFEPVFAVDADPAAVDATRRNARANEVWVRVTRADALVDRLPSAELAIANISEQALVALAPRLSSRTLVSSGYLADAHLELNGFAHAGRSFDEGWAADLWQRPQ